jgi:hypothetical protein
MRLFDYAGAEHYCKALAAAPASAVGSLKSYHNALTKSVRVFNEGTPRFDERRIAALHDVERQLFLGASNYLRALDLLISSAAPWAHVTLYYSAFFSANAILGMFGGWIDAPKRIVEVHTSTIGTQSLVLRKNVASPKPYTGSHRVFWDFFYDSRGQIAPWVKPALRPTLEPVMGDPIWQISRRNDVNYDAEIAHHAVSVFPPTLNSVNFRRSLSGPLATQLDVSEGLLLIAFDFAREFGLDSFALATLGVGKRKDCIKRLIVDAKLPKLVAQSKAAALVR